MLTQIITAGLLSASAVFGQPVVFIPGVRVDLRPRAFHVPVGQPVWVRFTLENTNDEPVTLTVPGTRPGLPSPESGLPLSHVFSGGSEGGVVVSTPTGRRWAQPVSYRTPKEAPVLMIAPKSTVGLTVDLRDYFPALRGAGQFRINWDPYAGAVKGQTVVVTIAPRKQAEIITDEGTMTVLFFYAEAPQHVENFVELAGRGFYNGLTFHRLEPGYLIQGGCPRGDGTGIRPDGKRLPAEFNSHPMEKGSVAMALLEDDPNSASCQFFIANTRESEWDGRYTVFGKLAGDESYATLDRLMETPVDDAGRPNKPLKIQTIRIADAPADYEP